MVNTPPGFGTVTPYIFAKHAESLVDFLVDAFGGIEVLRSQRPDGAIANSQIKVGNVTLMVSEATSSYPPMPASYYLYVENADVAMQKAIDRGATLEMEVQDMSYGDRQGGVRDPAGNIWWISQRLVNGPYAT